MGQNDSYRAIMFADISGSSMLYKQVGNALAKSTIDKTVAQMKHLTEAHQGIVVKTIGDEVMARFDNPVDACQAANAIQQRCSHPQTGDGLAVRIGMAYGSTLLDGEDVFGDTVNDAAWVSHVARARQTVITQAMVEALPPSVRNSCQAFDRVSIKGESQKTTIYRLEWESPALAQDASCNATAVMSVGNITQALILPLQIQFAGRQIDITPRDTPFTIGRDQSRVHLYVNSSLASRDHCHIEYRRGKFVLVDHSTNGTYVVTPDQPEIYLRREELPLFGQGSIGIGQAAEHAGNLAIHYRV